MVWTAFESDQKQIVIAAIGCKPYYATGSISIANCVAAETGLSPLLIADEQKQVRLGFGNETGV